MTETMKLKLQLRAGALFKEQSNLIHCKIDRLFGVLLVFEYLAGILIAMLVSPKVWAGEYSSVHVHVWVSVFLGGLIVFWPVYLAVRHPGKVITRHVIAIAQMLSSALLIHLTGGRIESHFHVFGSLAFISFYRDWRVLISATIVVAADHVLRGIIYPQSVYGINAIEPWRWVEHSWWVIFEDFFLINACLENCHEMRENASRQAEVEITRDSVEELVCDRTRQLQQLANIVQSSSEAIIAETVDGVITSWNGGAERLLGYTFAEVNGKDASILVPEELMGEYIQQNELVEETKTIETTRVGKGGRVVEVSEARFPIYDEHNRIVGISVFMRDIAEKKEAEKRVSEFYSIVSHELRTPLTSIRGALGLIEGGIITPDSPQLMELITVARSSSDRLIRLINDMLDLKKIEAGKMEMSVAKISAHEIVKATVRSLSGLAQETGVSIRCDINSDHSFNGDWDKLTQVLTNLGSNAIKFSPAGSIVTFDTQIMRDNRLRFTISDQGCGIADEHRDKLFEKFQQIDSSDTRQKGGTGLGLAICKALVEKHGGAIGFESVVGEGSTFWFELPDKMKPTTTSTSLSALSIGATIQSSSAGKEVERSTGHVLLVEDDDELATVIGTVIMQQGYQFTRADRLSRAKELLSEMVPDVVILDLTLPDGNGLDLLEYLRSNSATVDIPVIVSTGQQMQEKTMGNAAIVDWLMKPFDTSRLTSAVERALRYPGKCKVLVVDDDRDTRMVLSAQLRSAGLDCIEAKDGLEAIYLTRKESPDLIVLDVQMPNLDGFKVIEVLKNEDARSTPLVIYSGRDLTAAERQTLTLGVTKHLMKGQSQWALSDAINELLADVLTKSPDAVPTGSTDAKRLANVSPGSAA